jgi:hypothetical protein
VLWFPLPKGEGQGEGHSCYDSARAMSFETVSLSPGQVAQEIDHKSRKDGRNRRAGMLFFNRPLGTYWLFAGAMIPAINRRPIVKSPFGTPRKGPKLAPMPLPPCFKEGKWGDLKRSSALTYVTCLNANRYKPVAPSSAIFGTVQ